MATTKTTWTGESVKAFVRRSGDKQRQADCLVLIDMMEKQSGHKPKMWGPSIIGFGSYHYKYETGHEGDAPVIGFSPRKPAIVLYMGGILDQEQDLLNEAKR